MKNEGYKYDPDIIITSRFTDDLIGLTAERIMFEDIKYQNIKLPSSLNKVFSNEIGK